jgi:YgiT-type zinc finger domain-containing protein
MNCVICKNGEAQPGKTTVTLQRGESTIIFRGVPADICDNCGEYYLTDEVTAALMERAEAAMKQGAELEIQHCTLIICRCSTNFEWPNAPRGGRSKRLYIHLPPESLGYPPPFFLVSRLRLDTPSWRLCRPIPERYEARHGATQAMEVVPW